MYHEWNTAAKETNENNTDTFSGEDKGVMDESKIVPIVNKTNSAEAASAAATAEAAAQMVAQYAALPSAPLVGESAGQTPAQATGEPAGEPAAQEQPIIQPAGISAVQEQPTIQPEGLNTSQAGYSAGYSDSGNPAADAKSRTTDGYSAMASDAYGHTVSEPDADYVSSAAKETSGRSKKRRSFRYDPDDDFDFDEDERPKKRFFRFRSANDEESRDKMILSRIKDEELMEYLALEQRRLEFLQQAKEAKEKRILIAFQLLISLAAIVGITYLLQDNPTILISILYIVGIVAALNVWKNPHDRGWGKR